MLDKNRTVDQRIVRTVIVFVVSCLFFVLGLALDMDTAFGQALPNVEYGGILFLVVWFCIYFAYRLFVIWHPKYKNN
jgi:sterol desaturase/sphingolipid hydroxylase (fatty acid hydroxylase superfamily)